MGFYHVTTPTDGEVIISPHKFWLVHGCDDTYQAMISLAGEAWGNGRLRGSREFLLAAMAHAEVLGVPMRPSFIDRWATFRRWCAAVVLFVIGCLMLPDGKGNGDVRVFLVFLVTARVVFWWMRRKARRKEQRRIETGGFHYPRQTAGAKYADDDALRNGSLI